MGEMERTAATENTVAGSLCNELLTTPFCHQTESVISHSISRATQPKMCITYTRHVVQT